VWAKPQHEYLQRLACGAALLVLGLLLAGHWLWLRPAPLLLAPMVGQLEACLVQDGTRAGFPLEFQQIPDTCRGPHGSAAAQIRAALNRLGTDSADNALELGYTLPLPLLRYVQWSGSDWQVRGAALDRVVRTLAQVGKPVVLYLFATHFEVHSDAERRLAQDPQNLAATPDGPLPLGQFMGERIYPWSVARQDNDITRVRRLVMDALVQRLCAAPDAAAHLRAITLLGETHQLFPDFEAGMGFAAENYAVSDYSSASRAAFRAFLRQRYGSINRLNAHLQADFSGWDAIEPPARNIRSMRLAHFFEHIDSYAAGTLPVSGWVHVPDGAQQQRLQVAIYVDGKLHARVPVNKHRQDVLRARPDFAAPGYAPDVGWRADIHYPALGTGLHRIDAVLHDGARPLGLLATRRVAVMDRQQSTPRPPPAALARALPPLPALPAQVQFWVDSPPEQLALFHNPLARDWHDFRAQQVADYIRGFSAHLAQGCLAHVPRFSHQINPHPNPSWDADRYAADRSLRPLPGLALGVSLYGADSYAADLGRMLRRQRHSAYGITEFHPLVALDAARLRPVLAMHHQQGARFLSFFLETRSSAHTLVSNEFSFDPHNPAHGSDALYQAVRALLGNPEP